MRRLVLISQPRSGTNWHQDLVANAPNVLALREIFASKGVFGLQVPGAGGLEALRRLLARKDIDERSPEAIAWAHRDCEGTVAFFEDLARGMGRDAIAFTLLQGQLPKADAAKLLSHPQSRIVILLRRQLPRYVSELKANATGAWKHVETTNMRPRVDIDDFVAEASRTESWFEWVSGQADARILRYEDDLDRSGTEAFEAVRRTSPWLEPTRHPLRTRVTRQDRGGDVFDRVEDGPALRRELAARGLLEMATSYPRLPVRPSAISKSGAQS